MRIFFTLLLVAQSVFLYAQTDEDAEPIPSPKVLALDTTISMANRFNDAILSVATGYEFAFTDKEIPKTIKKVYKSAGNETLRIEYKYTTDGGDAEDGGKPVINFQRISGEAELMAKIYNYLFDDNVNSSQLMAVSSRGSEIIYNGNMHQFIFEPDDYSPGYWMMTFVR